MDTGRTKGETIDAYFGKSRFANAPGGTIGTLGHNVMLGPGTNNIDACLVKRLRLPFMVESGAGELRLEASKGGTRSSDPV